MLKEIVREYWPNRPMELAAALSYYTLLSLAPLVLMTVSLAGLVFKRAAVESTIGAELTYVRSVRARAAGPARQR